MPPKSTSSSEASFWNAPKPIVLRIVPPKPIRRNDESPLRLTLPLNEPFAKDCFPMASRREQAEKSMFVRLMVLRKA